MEAQLYTLADEKLWHKAWMSLPSDLRQPWLSPAWYALFESHGHGRACCFFFSDHRGFIIYPFLINQTPPELTPGNETYTDIQGAPGYNGAAGSCDDPLFIEDFQRHFADWCRLNLVVAEFSRCDPVAENHRFFPHLCIAESNRNIVADLRFFDESLKFFDRSAAKNVRKAQREGLTTEILPGNVITSAELELFADIYIDTLERNRADTHWFYTFEFLTDTARIMGEMALFCFTLHQNKPIAAEIVVAGETTAYSWIGGTLSEYFPKRPNDILKFGIMKHLQKTGRSNFCLGGGIVPGDGIFRYKKSFAPGGEVPFRILRRIHIPEIHEHLMSAWSSRYPDLVTKYGNRILAYRETP